MRSPAVAILAEPLDILGLGRVGHECGLEGVTSEEDAFVRSEAARPRLWQIAGEIVMRSIGSKGLGDRGEIEGRKLESAPSTNSWRR